MRRVQLEMGFDSRSFSRRHFHIRRLHALGDKYRLLESTGHRRAVGLIARGSMDSGLVLHGNV